MLNLNTNLFEDRPKIRSNFCRWIVNANFYAAKHTIFKHSSTFRVKKRVEKLKIRSLKTTQKIEKSMPLKSLFVFSRYLNPLPRYKGLKLSVTLNIARRLWMEPWPTLHAYYVFLGIASGTCLEFGIGQRDEERAKDPSMRQGCK